jgi:hypothetical protein
MVAVRIHVVRLYVDRSSHRWVVLDSEGSYWVIPDGEDAWERREPFFPNDEAELDPIPGHYKYTLGLPT